MTNTYKTLNPLGSNNARDLSDNASNFDEYMNSDLPSIKDRFDKRRETLAGNQVAFDDAQEGRAQEFTEAQTERESEFNTDQSEREAAFQTFLEGTGWSSIGSYGAGVSITSHTQTVDYQGQPYALKPSVPASINAPYVTSGNWAVEGVNFKLVGDNSLRQDLALTTDLTKGGTAIGRATVTVPSIVELLAHPQRTDLRVIPASYHPGLGNGGGSFIWNPTLARSSHNGGTVISPTVPWNGTPAAHAAFLLGTGETAPAALGCWVRPPEDSYSLPKFGAIADFVDYDTPAYDNRFALEASLKSVYSTTIPKAAKGYGVGKNGSAFISMIPGRRLSGEAELQKMGPKGILSFSQCTDIQIKGLVFDGQILKDEANFGSIVGNARAAENYAFAVSFANCNNCGIRRATARGFAWDGFVAQGSVAVGGASATQSDNIDISFCTTTEIRGTMIWTKAIKNSKINNNNQFNPTTFSQKANAIFAVEWCDNVEIAHNTQSYIGDNAIGIGEMLSTNVAARNKRMKVHHNNIDTTRYHSILIAQAENSEFTYNNINLGGAKTAMVGPSGTVVCGAITMLGGGSATSNKGNIVGFNTITNPYEHGIYGYDRVGTTLANGSILNEFIFNKITGFGLPPLPEGSTRLASSGMTLQFANPQKVHSNTVADGVNDGYRIFGDVDFSGNTSSRCTGLGINIPTDTIWGNTLLSYPIRDCAARDCGQAGILVASKTSLSYAGLVAERCGNLPAPATETTANALLAAGISFRSIGRLVGSGSIARGNGSAGMMTQFCPSIKDTGGTYDANGAVFVTNNFKSGVYAEGATGNLVKAIFEQTSGDAGASQYYPIRILFGATDSVALDALFTNHPSTSIGIVAKSLINI